MYQSKEITKKVYNNINKINADIKNGYYIYELWRSKTSDPRVLTRKLTDKLDFRRGKKSIAVSNLSIYYTWKTIRNLYNNKKFKISAPTWNDKFELSDWSYSVSNIKDYFEYILKKIWLKHR